MPSLKISTEQMIALHGFFADAARVSESDLAELSGCDTEIEIYEIRCTALGDFGDRGMQLSDDLVAGVMGRLEGCLLYTSPSPRDQRGSRMPSSA